MGGAGDRGKRKKEEEKWRWLVSRGTAERMADERRRDGVRVRQKERRGDRKSVY